MHKMSKPEREHVILEYQDGLLFNQKNPMHNPMHSVDDDDHSGYLKFLSGLSVEGRQIDLGVCTYVKGYCLSPHIAVPPEMSDPSGEVAREIMKRLISHFNYMVESSVRQYGENPISRKWQSKLIYGEFKESSIHLEIAVNTSSVFETFDNFKPSRDFHDLGIKMEQWIDFNIFDLLDKPHPY